MEKKCADKNSPPVIIIHGLFSPQITINVLAIPLKLDGFKIYSLNLPPLNFCSIKRSAAILDKKVSSLINEGGYEKVNIIGMSLGGIIGYYFVKMFDNAKFVSKMISVGGPLNGVRIADVVSKFPLLKYAPALCEIKTDSKLIEELQKSLPPDGVKVISMGAKTDPLCPEKAYTVCDAKIIHSPYKFFPLTHHLLYLHRGNYKMLREELWES